MDRENMNLKEMTSRWNWRRWTYETFFFFVDKRTYEPVTFDFTQIPDFYFVFYTNDLKLL